MSRSSTQKAVLPVVIPEANFDFVLLGPVEGEQQVLARSSNADPILLGMARIPAHLGQPRRTATPPDLRESGEAVVKCYPGLYQNDPDATLYAVTEFAHVSENPDARDEPFVFAWVGWTPKADLRSIRSYFGNSLVSIQRAFQEEERDEKVTWVLAPLLFLCARWTKTIRGTDPPQKATQPILSNLPWVNWSLLGLVSAHVLFCYIYAIITLWLR